MKPIQLYDYQQEMVERILSVLSEPGKHRYVDEKLKNSGYQFKWTFEEALADWLKDNNGEGLK